MTIQQPLNTTIIQADLTWENPAINLAHFDKELVALYGKTDLAVLPEMFTTGFSMKPQGLASGEEILSWLKEHATQGNFAIYGSVMFKEEAVFVNKGIFMRPDGTYDTYNKRHTFTLAGEHEIYARGTAPVIATYKGWKFNLQICYDLRFPVFARNTRDYDVLLYVANWPVPRVNAWDALLKARAIENMCYCIGVNRVGTDGNGMDYSGHSQVYDVLGHECSEHPWETAGTQNFVLDKQHIKSLRSKLRFLQDRDGFKLA
jgi:predicted amidohydrolase